MSHIPATERAQEIFGSLVSDRAKVWPYYVFPGDVDKATLREVLVSLVCPIPCAGELNDAGWHQLCLDRADAAMKELFDY